MARFVVLIAAIAFAVLAAGCGSSERVGEEHSRTVHVLTMLKPIGNAEELGPFAGEVERLSHGKLRIRIIPSGYSDRPDFEAATVQDMQHGRADLSWAASRVWDEFGAHRLRALHAPFLIDSYALEQRVLQSDLAAGMLDELQPLGLVGIGILPGGMRHPFGVSRRLAAPSDYTDLTIGTQESRIADATMRAFGARPIRVPADTLGLKAVDGLEQRVYTLQGDRLAVKGSHVTANVDLWPRPLVIYAAARAYKRLTADEREVLHKAASDALPKAVPMARHADAESTGDLCRKGDVSFDLAAPSELRALRQAVAPVYRELERDPATRAAIEQIETLKTQVGQPADVLPRCTRRTSAAPAAATALDGVWQMDANQKVAHADDTDENWGHWIFVFKRGRFAITQENARACTWGYGTFSVRGDRTSWKFTDGGGLAPNNAENKPGEFFVFGLSAYHDTLRLTPAHGAISPFNFRVKPWRRLAAAPSRRFFSTRCPPPVRALSG